MSHSTVTPAPAPPQQTSQSAMRSRRERKLRVVTGRQPASAAVQPRCCCGSREKPCLNQIYFRIDGAWFCYPHSEQFWLTHFVDEHKVERLFSDDSYRR